jgi:hypothetical protein
MPSDERTEFATPIPLRRNGSSGEPNPFSRIEAAEKVAARTTLLSTLVEAGVPPVNQVGLAAVLIQLSAALETALHGPLADVEELIENCAPLGTWGQAVGDVLWPSRVSSRLHTRAEDCPGASWPCGCPTGASAERGRLDLE